MALLDSASGLNLIKKDVFDNNFQVSKKQVRESWIRVKGVNGVISRASGEIDLKLEIMDKEFTFLFVLIDDAQFPTDVLLGYNALRQSNLVTDWKTGQVWFSEANSHIKQCHNVQPVIRISGLDRVPEDTGVPRKCEGLQDKVHLDVFDDEYIQESVGCRLQDISVIHHALHNTLGGEGTSGTTHTQDTDHIDVESVREVLMTNAEVKGDSCISLEDLEKVKVFVRKPVSVEPDSLVRLDFNCPSMETADGVCLTILNESCKVKDLALDNTIVNIVNGNGFCYVRNMTEFVKNVDVNVCFADAVVVTPDIDFVDIVLPENKEQRESRVGEGMFRGDSGIEDLFDVDVAVTTSVDSQYRRSVENELKSIDFPEYRNLLSNILLDCRKAIAVEGDELGRTSLIKHRIDLVPGSRPKYIPAYRMPHSRKAIVKELVDDMVRQGVVSPSSSPYNSPLILVPKKSGQLRPCVDFRKLNGITVPDRYPMPVLSEVLSNLGGKKVFSTLDLLSGFWQIELEEESKPLTAFSTPNGHFQFNCMPFGLRNSPITFVRLMNLVFQDMKPGSILTYLDDVIIFSESPGEHLKDLKTVLVKLEEVGLKVKLTKCQFLRKKLSFLGHVVSGDGISVQDDKIEKIKSYPAPKSEKSLRRFLGLCGYYRPFIFQYATICKPLTLLLQKAVDYEWGDTQERAFETLKSKLMKAPVLIYPDYEKPFIIACDASDLGIGSALLQKGPRRLMPIAFASKLFSDTERRYSVTEREAMAVTWSLRKFRDICLGYKVTVLTDHQPVTHLFRNRNLSGKLARWFLHVQEFEPEIKYIPGPRNTIADALSRVGEDLDIDPTLLATYTVQEVELDVDLVRLEQSKDRDLSVILNSMNGQDNPDGYTIVDGVLFKQVIDGEGVKRSCLCVPSSLVDKVLFLLHSHKLAGHPGVNKTVLMAKRNYYWKNMATQVREYVLRCETCMSFKGNVSQKAVLETYPTELEPWECVAMDFMGPLTTTHRETDFYLFL